VDRSELLDRLDNADNDVAEAERYLARQPDLLRSLGLDRDTADAEILLGDLKSALVLSIREREKIRAELERLPSSSAK
jgi:hypothetical protein